MARRPKGRSSERAAEPVCAQRWRQPPDLAASCGNTPANATASTMGTVAVESASVLSEAENAERDAEDAKLVSYMRGLGML
jgi:hypothetical protein